MSNKEPGSELNPIDSTSMASAVEPSDLLHAEPTMVVDETSTQTMTEAVGIPFDVALSAYQFPGQILAARRNELRWSQEEAAERLKLTLRQVNSLETDDFGSLPGMASVRGFVRAYAKAMGLDPQPLLDLLANEPNPAHGPMVLRRPLPANGFPGRRSSPLPRGSKWRRRFGFMLAIVIATLAVGAVAYRSQWVPASFIAEMSVPVNLPEFSRISADILSVPESIRALKASTDAEQPEIREEPAVATRARASMLELKIQEDAWVEITTLSGQKIVSRLMKAGTTESFDISEPAILVVGNASAVDARLRGQPLNLKAVARDNVSKLSLK